MTSAIPQSIPISKRSSTSFGTLKPGLSICDGTAAVRVTLGTASCRISWLRQTEGSTWRTRQYNPTFAAWGRPQVWHEGSADKIEPAAGPHYEGPVYVLTSPRTCSAAEDFLIPLKMSMRITIVGEPTCGSTGQPLEFSLYAATARVCTKWDRFPDGTEFVGVGVVPDVKAAPTKSDVASGRDGVLQTALELASRNRSQ